MDYLSKLFANRRRDKTIKRLRSRGWTMQRIADQVKITRQRVHQVLAKTESRKLPGLAVQNQRGEGGRYLLSQKP